MQQAKLMIPAGLHELKIITVRDQSAIDQKVLEENLVQRLLIVESELVVFGVRRPVAAFVAGAPLANPVPQLKQSTLDLSHAAYAFNRERRRRDWRVEL